MKTKLLYLITLFFTISSFAQSSSCGLILEDTFEEGTTQSNHWTEYNTEGRVTVENGRLKFNHNTTKPSAYRTFTPITKNTSFSFDVATSRNSVNCQIHLLSSTGKHLSSIAVGIQTASIKYASTFRNNIPNDFLPGDPPGGLFTNTTYNVRSEIDFESKTVSFYNADVLMAADIPFLEDAEDIAKIDIQLIYMYSNNGQFYFDNISMLSGDDNRLELTSNTIDAETLINSAAIGNDYDQYPQSSVDAFQAEIDKANVIVDNCDATSVAVDSALSDLNTAKEVFLASRNSGQVFLLENAKGIITDNLGAVIKWENQIEGFGDAVQDDSNLGAEESQETYPGKTTILFNKEGSYLELEGSSNHISDNNYSVFYVGKAENATTDKPASLLGNYDMSGGFSNAKGIRFVKLQDGKIGFDYAKPNYTRVVLGDNEIPAENYFFFGFSMDASGNYKYFDSTSPVISTGTIPDAMHINANENLTFNLFEEVAGSNTYNQTEVVELAMYKLSLDTSKFQDEYNRLATEYAELVKSAFSVTEVLPENRTGLPTDADITINFSQSVDATSEYPKIFVNKSDTEEAGTWNLSSPNSLTFSPTENWPAKALVSLQMQEGLKSTDGVFVGLAKGDTYNFIVESDKIYEYVNYELDEPIATVDFPIAGHKLPLKLTTPVINNNTTEKFPVHIWVHGGGWSGGTQESSSASYSPHGDYLAENLGIATLGIAYRCAGSSGTFSLALDDVRTAYQWALDNADTYNFDMTKVFISGGSAGTPLGAMIAQEYDGVIGFIGFNGIYDFVNDAGDFGVGNWYKQNVPSETANSPLFQLSDHPPATILMHGDADTTISHTQSTRFAEAINEAGSSAEAVIFPGEQHAFFNLGQSAYEDVLIEMVNFISKTLKEKENLSTDTFLQKDKIVAYPNPVKRGNILKLNTDYTIDNIDLQIVNQLGQIILNKKTYTIENGVINIETKAFKSGLYVLRTSVNQTSNSIKLIIE